MPFTVGVIGAGFGRRVVAPAFSALEDTEVIDVVSARDDQAVSQLCARGDLDLICVHSPPSHHARHVIEALEHGHPRAVLCDKPLGLDPEDSTRMLEAAEAAGALHFTNFEFRHLEARRELRTIAMSGDIGEPVQLVWSHFSNGTVHPLRPFGWLFDRAQGGGWVGAWASHAVDTVRWLMGEITHVAAVQGTLIGERPDHDGMARRVEAEDSLSALLTTENHRVAVLTSSFASSAPVEPRILLMGTAGLVECVDDHVLVTTRADGSVHRWQAPAGERHMRAMTAWAQVIREATDSGRQQAPSFADGIACDRILNQMRASPWLRWGDHPQGASVDGGSVASVSSGGGDV